MLQHVLVKRIERLHRLRLIYGIHLALYGIMLVVGALMIAPTDWHTAALVLLLWLPLLMAHTAAQSLYELYQSRMVYQPIPVESFARFNRPVDLYDENGRPIQHSTKIDYLPR